MTWDAPGTVLVIGAFFAGVVAVIQTWRTGLKVDRLGANTTEKLNQIHDATNGGLSDVKTQNRVLVEELRRVLAEHQDITNTALSAALAKNVTLEAEVVKRADAAVPPARPANERKGD